MTSSIAETNLLIEAHYSCREVDDDFSLSELDFESIRSSMEFMMKRASKEEGAGEQCKLYNIIEFS